MNCQAIQNQIINLPDPRELPPALRDHVVGCGECRAWARKAARLESLLAQLPVPPAPSEKKEAMIEELTVAEPVIRSVPSVPPHGGAWFAATGRFLRRNATSVGGLAAAVLVAGGIYWLANRSSEPRREVVQTQKHPLLEKVSRANVALARADNSPKRLEALGGMADELASETRGMARIASPDELRQMAGWYEKVVAKGIVPQAEKLPLYMTAAEKQTLLDAMAKKLEADATEAERVMGEAPPDSQPALKRMAETAREGEKKLRALTRQGS